jgi:predicted dehydrogenase
MDRLRGAIVGFGNVAARGHWPGLAASADLEIVAVVDPSAARRAAAEAAAPGIRSYSTIEDLAAREALDFVDVATPPSSHAPLVAASLERGWHVICEKPLTLDPGTFTRLAAAARARDRVLFTMHNWKVAPIFQAAFGAIRAGRIGCVRHVDVLVFRNQPCKGASDGTSARANAAAEDWRQQREVAGGGILVDHGWYNFYLLLNLVGADPEQVTASLTHGGDDPAALDDSARVMVVFPQADAFLHLTWRASHRRNVVMVYGDEGGLLIDDDRLVVSRRGEPTEEATFPAGLSAGSHHEDWFRALLPHFVDEVRETAGRGVNLREAGWCVALTDAAYRSGACGGVMEEVSAFALT